MKKNVFLLLALSVVAMMCITSCSDDNGNNLPQPEPPVDFEQMKESAIREFINYAKNPRAGYHLDQARAYLKSVAEANGWKWERDAYGNCWIDVPATKGYEHFPNVILQGHMDMVCAVAEDEIHDILTEVGTPVREGNFLRGEHINLGADNGIGVGMMLAIIKSEAGHGPIRCLFTADEDQGLDGAASLDASTINADFLISLDGEEKGQVYRSSAGGGTSLISGRLDEASTVEGLKKLTVNIKGLRGGHSGRDIADHRLSASVMVIDIVKTISSSHNISLISFMSGTADNAIANNAILEIAVNVAEATAVENEIIAVINDFATEYPEEDVVSSVKASDIETDDYVCDSSATPSMVALFEGLSYGPFEFSSIIPNHVTKSCNISPLILLDGIFSVELMYRSDYEDWLEEQQEYYEELADGLKFDHEVLMTYPAWFSETEYPMVTMLKEYYSEAIGTMVTDYMTQGGIEAGYFVRLNPNLQLTCFGPQIDDAHTINETLHIDNVKSVLYATVKTIQNLDKLKK